MIDVLAPSFEVFLHFSPKKLCLVMPPVWSTVRKVNKMEGACGEEDEGEATGRSEHHRHIFDDSD